MSTNPTPTTEPHTTTRTTEIATRRGTDPWTAPGETPTSGGPSALAQRQFEPTARDRLKNLVDEENAYCE